MKSRTSHLIHLLVWLLVLTAYVVVLNRSAPGSRSSAHHPCGVGWDCRGPGLVGLSDHEETRGLSVPTISLFNIRSKQMGSPWNNPSVPRRARARWEAADRPAESQTPQGGPLQWPRCFPGVLPAQGGPAVLGLGSLFDGRSPSGSGPAGRAAAAGPAGLWCRWQGPGAAFGSPAGAVWG